MKHKIAYTVSGSVAGLSIAQSGTVPATVAGIAILVNGGIAPDSKKLSSAHFQSRCQVLLKSLESGSNLMIGRINCRLQK